MFMRDSLTHSVVMYSFRHNDDFGEIFLLISSIPRLPFHLAFCNLSIDDKFSDHSLEL